MSLQYLGISHFPVLHRQFSSPIRGAFSDSSPSQQDLTEDSKDVLIERLNDLVQRLSTAQELDDGAVTAVHSQVDKIEMILKGEEKQKKPSHSRSSSGVPRDSPDPFWAPATPTKSIRMRLPDTSTRSQRPPLRRNLQEVSSVKASELAQAAEDLASRMAVTLEEFQRRKEESDVSSLVGVYRTSLLTSESMFTIYSSHVLKGQLRESWSWSTGLQRCRSIH